MIMMLDRAYSVIDEASLLTSLAAVTYDLLICLTCVCVSWMLGSLDFSSL